MVDSPERFSKSEWSLSTVRARIETNLKKMTLPTDAQHEFEEKNRDRQKEKREKNKE